jgi:hypothetical protein
MHRMKREVILRILAQESLKSELRLRRYGEKNFRDLLVIYNGKFRGLSPRCGGPATRSGPRWTAGDTDTGLGGALPACGARALGLTGARRRGTTGRGGHGELNGLLTEAWAAMWRPGDGGDERWQLELVVRAKEGAKGLRREGKRCGEVRGCCSPFIGVGGEPGRGCRGVTMALVSLMPLKMARLRGGLRRGS